LNIETKGSPVARPLIAFLATSLFLALNLPSRAADLAGQASVIDGDSIEIHGTNVRLFGIDAPESSQLCRNEDGAHYRCGQIASNALFDFIAKRPVECVDLDTRSWKRVVAVCNVAGTDLADWMVRNGHALDWPQYSKGGYAAAQDEAKRTERGLWSGSFVEPWRYRRCIRSGGKPVTCSDLQNDSAF
jgi:endonuclease YncB( thermonuclease family)